MSEEVRGIGRRVLLVPGSRIQRTSGASPSVIIPFRWQARRQPDYHRRVCQGTTGHAEVVQVKFDLRPT